MNNFTIEKAVSSLNKKVGYRLQVGVETYLIFDDQLNMPGLRLGDKFVASLGEEITYISGDLNFVK